MPRPVPPAQPGSAPAPATGAEWKTNTSIPELALWLRSVRTAIVVTHAKPDGDAIGSAMAVARSLRAMNVNAQLMLVGPLPRWGGLILSEPGMPVPSRVLAPGTPCKPADGSEWDHPSPDAILVVDTGSWSQLAELRSWLAPLAGRACVIDHHLRGDGDTAARRLVDCRAASCTQVLAPLCTAILGLQSPTRLPREIAESLYLGLATDTGWFRYSNVTPDTLRLAADLCEAGADHTRLYRLIEQQDLPGRWKLLGRALNTLELHHNGRAATMELRRDDFAQTGADRNDTSGFADMILTIQSVDVAAVLTEEDAGPGNTPLTKISFRSKPGAGAIDVNELAGKLGGGGHARAAGGKLQATLPDAKARLLEALSRLQYRA